MTLDDLIAPLLDECQEGLAVERLEMVRELLAWGLAIKAAAKLTGDESDPTRARSMTIQMNAGCDGQFLAFVHPGTFDVGNCEMFRNPTPDAIFPYLAHLAEEPVEA